MEYSRTKHLSHDDGQQTVWKGCAKLNPLHYHTLTKKLPFTRTASFLSFREGTGGADLEGRKDHLYLYDTTTFHFPDEQWFHAYLPREGYLQNWKTESIDGKKKAGFGSEIKIASYSCIWSWENKSFFIIRYPFFETCFELGSGGRNIFFHMREKKEVVAVSNTLIFCIAPNGRVFFVRFDPSKTYR